VKKTLFVAAAACTLLVSAAPPGPPAMPGDEGVDYPPCSRSVRDRCIQLHEPGVATPENLAINRGDYDSDRYAEGPDEDEMGPPPERYAGNGPYDDDLPPPGMRRHHHMMPPPGAPSEMESVVAPPPPDMPTRMAMNDYPPCADASSDGCVQRRVIVYRQPVRMLRIGERG
jgi:hypothetical protein